MPVSHNPGVRHTQKVFSKIVWKKMFLDLGACVNYDRHNMHAMLQTLIGRDKGLPNMEVSRAGPENGAEMFPVSEKGKLKKRKIK